MPAAEAAAAHQRQRGERAEHGRGASPTGTRCASDIQAASSIALIVAAAPRYQRVDQPPQTVTSREALNE